MASPFNALLTQSGKRRNSEPSYGTDYATTVYLGDDTTSRDSVYGYTDPALQAVNKAYYTAGGLTPVDYAKGTLDQSLLQGNLRGGVTTGTTSVTDKSHYQIEPNTDGTLDADRILKSLPAWKPVTPAQITPTDYHHVYHHSGHLNLSGPEQRWLSERYFRTPLGALPSNKNTTSKISTIDSTVGVRNDIDSNYARYLYDRYFQTHGEGRPMINNDSEVRFNVNRSLSGLLGSSVSLQ